MKRYRNGDRNEYPAKMRNKNEHNESKDTNNDESNKKSRKEKRTRDDGIYDNKKEYKDDDFSDDHSRYRKKRRMSDNDTNFSDDQQSYKKYQKNDDYSRKRHQFSDEDGNDDDTNSRNKYKREKKRKNSEEDDANSQYKYKKHQKKRDLNENDDDDTNSQYKYKKRDKRKNIDDEYDDSNSQLKYRRDQKRRNFDDDVDECDSNSQHKYKRDQKRNNFDDENDTNSQYKYKQHQKKRDFNENDDDDDDTNSQFKYRRDQKRRNFDDEDDDDDDIDTNSHYKYKRYQKKRDFNENDDDDSNSQFKYRRDQKRRNFDDDDDIDTNYKNKRYQKKRDFNENDDDEDTNLQHKYKQNQKKRNIDDENDDNKTYKTKKDFNHQGKNDNDFTTKIQVKSFAISDFFSLLVNAFLNDPQYEKEFGLINQNKFSISNKNDQTFLHFSPKTTNSTDLMKRAISCAETLMPFTPKTILYHNDYPNCAIEVTVNGSSKYESVLHLVNKVNKNLPKVFNINKEVIEFLCQKVNELSSSMNLYRIALTGEALSFSLDENHHEVRYNQIKITNCPTVFGKKYDDKNRLIVLISQGEEMPPNQKELDWMIQSVNKDEELIQIAASLAKGLVRCYHAHDLYVVKESPEFSYAGPEKVFVTLGLGRNSKIKDICNVLYRDFTRGTFLTKDIPVSNLQFVEKGKDNISNIQLQLDNLFIEKKKYNIDHLKSRKDHLFKVIQSSKSKPPASVGNELTRVKADINRFYDINRRIDELKQKKENLLKSNVDEKSLKKNLVERIEREGLQGRVVQMFGCNVFSSSEPISSKDDQMIEDKLLKIERDLKINAFCVEKLCSATIVVSHRSTSPHSPDQFHTIIQKVCDKFSFIVSFCSNYIPQEKQKGQIGIIFIEVIDPQFTIIVVSEIKKTLLGEPINIFRIPTKIASKMMLQDKRNQEIITKWIKQNQLLSIKFNGENWFGSKEDVSKAYNLLSKSDTCIQFFQKVILLPPLINMERINKLVRENNWIYDHLSHCIIVNSKDIKSSTDKIFSEFNQNKKNGMNDDDEELIGCIYVCENKIPSSLPLTIYNKDGSYKTDYLCNECIESTIDSIIGCFFEDGIGIDFDKLLSVSNLIDPIAICDDSLEKGSDQYWPKVPIGQLLWNLVNDPYFSERAKAWFTAVLSQSLHVHPEIVTFCPYHPHIILPLPNSHERLNCSIKTCKMILCPNCNEWHEEDKCSNYEWQGMRCPGCGRPTFKDVGCNHISCVCGAHWCYKCGAGPFKFSHVCYDHMSKMHGGYFT